MSNIYHYTIEVYERLLRASCSLRKDFIVLVKCIRSEIYPYNEKCEKLVLGVNLNYKLPSTYLIFYKLQMHYPLYWLTKNDKKLTGNAKG